MFRLRMDMWLILRITWARGNKTFFILDSAENEICSAYKKLNTTILNFFLQSSAEHEIFPANKY